MRVSGESLENQEKSVEVQMYLSICLKLQNVFVSNYKMHLSQISKCVCLKLDDYSVWLFGIYFVVFGNWFCYLVLGCLVLVT